MAHPLILPMAAHVPLMHSGVQSFTTTARLRGLVFTINFLATIGLWVVAT